MGRTKQYSIEQAHISNPVFSERDVAAWAIRRPAAHQDSHAAIS
jgi:hypothetical protein